MGNLNLSINEKSVLEAIKNGFNNIESITNETKLPVNLVHLLAGKLTRDQLVRRNPNNKTFIIHDGVSNKIVCYGNLLIPVKFYVNKDTNQRYAIRDTWNPIGDNITEDDIDWIDDTMEKNNRKVSKDVKKRDKLDTPSRKVVVKSKYNEWLNSPIEDIKIDNVKFSKEHKATKSKVDLILNIGDTRDGLTEYGAELIFNIGKLNWKSKVTLKPQLLLETGELVNYLNGNTKAPFKLIDFIWKNPNSKTQYPLDAVINKDTSYTITTIQFIKLKSDEWTWSINKIECDHDKIRPTTTEVEQCKGTPLEALELLKGSLVEKLINSK